MSKLIQHTICGLYNKSTNTSLAICGNSKVGKSSIAMTLLAERDNWQLIGDDPTVFQFDYDSYDLCFEREQLGKSGWHVGGKRYVSFLTPNGAAFTEVIVPESKIWQPSADNTPVDYLVRLHKLDLPATLRPIENRSYFNFPLDDDFDEAGLSEYEVFTEALFSAKVPIIDLGIKRMNLQESVKAIEECERLFNETKS